MAASAEGRAVGEGERAAIARLQQGQVRFVVAVEAVVVPAVLAMPHHNVRMLLGNDQVLLPVETQHRGFVLLVTGIAVEVRKVLFGPDQAGIGPAHRRGVEEGGIHQRNRRKRLRVSPQVEQKGRRQPAKQHDRCAQEQRTPVARLLRVG